LGSIPVFINPWTQELCPRDLFACQNHLKKNFKYRLLGLPLGQLNENILK
jgi:hypothetical protein